MNKFFRFIQLSRLEKRVFFQALLLLPLTAIAMRIFGFRRVYSFLVQGFLLHSTTNKGRNFLKD